MVDSVAEIKLNPTSMDDSKCAIMGMSRHDKTNTFVLRTGSYETGLELLQFNLHGLITKKCKQVPYF